MQPQGQVQVLLNILRGFNVQAALDAPRFCIDAEATIDEGSTTSKVFIEEGISPDSVDELRSKSPPAPSPFDEQLAKRIFMNLDRIGAPRRVFDRYF